MTKEEIRAESKRLIEAHDALIAMKQSVIETDKRFNKEVEEFMDKCLKVNKGKAVSVMDIVEKTMGLYD